MRRFLAVACFLLSFPIAGAQAQTPGGGPPGKPPDTTQQRVAGCINCHGKNGEGIRSNEYYPRIAGKPSTYLYNQLVNFREGRRTFPQMGYLVRYMSNEYLKEVADYFSKLKPPFPPPSRASVSAASLQRGEQLVTRGDPQRDIPACSACHGSQLTGMLPAIPALVGLYPDYIQAQLSNWKQGTRQAAAPDCMGQIATLLNGQDIAAVAAWLSTQRGNPNIPPAAAQPDKMPLTCGSETPP
jgi:cytochrome c553